MRHVPATPPQPGEEIFTAMRFAACEPDDERGLKEIWRELHDSFLETFPTQRRGPIGMATYGAEGVDEILADLDQPAYRGVDERAFDELRQQAKSLGLLVIVHVDVVRELAS